jgi:predicted amidohydrolase YtcJ
MDAIRLMTYNPAYASFEENLKGSLEAGKLADLVILSQPLGKAAAREIKEVEVETTFLDGQAVYQKK